MPSKRKPRIPQKRRYGRVTPELRAEVSRLYTEDRMSKRKICTHLDIPWSRMERALKESIALRVPEDVKRSVADEVNVERVRKARKYLTNLKFTDQAAGGAVSEFHPHSAQSQAIDEFYGLVVADGSGRKYVTLGCVCIPKRNGKTLLCACLSLLHMDGPEAVSGGVIAVVAENVPQAKLLLRYVKDIVDCTPSLHGKFKFTGLNNPRPRVECLTTGVTMHILPGTYEAVSGMSINMFIIDEYALHPNAEAMYALRQSQSSIVEPLGIVISTRSDIPGNPMAELLERHERIQSGIEDANGFSMIFLGMTDDEVKNHWDEIEPYRRVNPGMPHSPKESAILELIEEARHNTLAKRKLLTYNGNAEMTAVNALFDFELWTECADAGLTLDDLRGEECFGGLDLSSVRDMTAFVLYFPESGAVFPWAWLPTSTVNEVTLTTKIRYRDWVDQGFMATAGDDVIGYGEIVSVVADICNGHNVKAIAYDKKFYLDFDIAIARMGAAMPSMIEFPQTFASYTVAINHVEEALYTRRLRHPCNPVLDWAVKFTSAREGRYEIDARMPVKMSSVKIDPCVSMIMAIGLAARWGAEMPDTDWGAMADLLT